MRLFSICLFLLTSVAGFSQKLKFKVLNQKDTTVHLVKYYGKGLYYADTAEMKNGVVTFNGKKQKAGILALLLPGQKYFEFIYNNEDIDMQTSTADFIENMKVNKSDENKLFQAYIKFIGDKKKTASMNSKEAESLAKDDPKKLQLQKENEAIGKEVSDYQKKLIAENPTKLVSNVVRMSMDVIIPDSPRKADGSQIDSLFAYKHYRDHYFDNIDLQDDRLVNTPLYHNKLEYFFGKQMLLQQPDTILKFAFRHCDQLKRGSEMFKYNVSWITSNFEKSNIMGMDKVFVRMGERYYCSKDKTTGKSPAFWMDSIKLEELCDKVTKNLRLVQGERPPNICLRDTSDVTWKDYYSLKNEYTVLYFWEPNCGHCKKTTPKLGQLYNEKFKGRGIDVFAVAKATGDEFEMWKKFVKDNKLEFINVGLTRSLFEKALENASLFVPKYTNIESLNYSKTFDVSSTPRVFVLDKDKKIIAKALSIAQLEEFLDRLQGKADLPKIFKVEDDKKDEEDADKEKH